MNVNLKPFKRLNILSILFMTALILSRCSFALSLELTEGVNQAFPIGIDGFGPSQNARDLVQVVDGDLRLSGQFKLIPAPRVTGGGKPPISLWQEVGVDSVLTGNITELEDGRYNVHVELLDVAARGQSLILKDYQIEPSQLRALGHHISDQVYYAITGVPGVFSTKIAYVLVTRDRNGSEFSLEISDMDGRNPHALVTSSAPIMSPSWSPDGKYIAYVSFERKRAQIFAISVETAQRQLITDFAGINGAPAWSPDGKNLAVVLSKNGSPKIYTVSLKTGEMKQLTYGLSIDTEPSYSKDGQSIVFTSGRGGTPQVYQLNVTNGEISRLTFEGNYNARPSLTPDQNSLVILHRSDKKFNIGIQNLDTGRLNVLTRADADEAPSVAPNGRFIVYATERNGKGLLGLVSTDGEIHKLYPKRPGDVQEPAWSPLFG